MKTAKQISLFLNFAQSYLGQNPGETKFAYALRRMQKRAETIGEEHNDAVRDINIKHCATNKDGVILKDSRGGFEFTKEKLGLVNTELRELAKKEYDLEPYIATEPPPEPLSYEVREVCYGFVLEEPKE